MATKLRNFSTHPLSKATAVLLSVVMVFLLVYNLYDFAFDAYHSKVSPEALLTSSYVDSGEYYDWVSALAWDLYSVANSDSPASEIKRFTDTDVLYRITVGDTVYTNAEQMTLQQLMPDDGRYISVEEGLLSTHFPGAEDYSFFSGFPVHEFPSEGFSAVVYIPDDLIAQRQIDWVVSGETLRSDLGFICLSALPLILLTVFLCIVTGRVPADRELHCGRADCIWTELLLAAFLSISGLAVAMAWAFVGESFYWSRGIWANRTAVVTLCGLSLSAGYCLSLPFFLAMVRKIKARRFFRHTAIGALLRFIARLLRTALLFLRGLFDGSAYRNYSFIDAMFRRRAAYITGSTLCVFLFFVLISSGSALFFIALVLEIAITWWYVRSGNEILHDISGVMDQVSRISAGDLSWTPGLPSDSPLIQVSSQLSEIGGGMQKSVEKQMQSERMKVELVTNVSHDLKTPLTSIISYVDLLSKTQGLTDEARDYVSILAQKSDRLKSLVYDLFELAKSTSGSMEIHFEALDFHRLVEQTLGEMQERIDASQLALRVSLAEAPVIIWADGRKMYRVLQNVIDNALKYSLTGTRIFVDLSVIGERAVLSVKNTAGYEMDFSAEEITERFVRGDKARTAEGSGLGLSIAQSFTQACGGHFHVEVDGDQFKVHISFNLHGSNREL